MSRPEQGATPAVDQPAGGLCELAAVSSGRWHVCIDESHDGQAHFLELDGPTAYLCVSLGGLPVVEGFRRFLEKPSPREKA